jgi:hypothetical protein
VNGKRSTDTLVCALNCAKRESKNSRSGVNGKHGVKMKYILIILILVITLSVSAEILIPMDLTQSNHLKAYGVAFSALKMQMTVKWLLNYRGGSWIIPDSPEIEGLCNIRGVSYENVSAIEIASITAEIETSNMDIVVLEKEPTIAIYTPPNKQPWDDAVTLALTYAEIEYETVWDEEVLSGKLDKYDWLHAVAEKIREYVKNGGFLFAMCAATDTFDIALAARNVDICESVFDGDGLDPDYQSKLDFSRTFAFENFELITNPFVYEFSEIDASDYAKLRGAEADYFTLFDFSAKYDPVPTMLTQCHTSIINGFLGQTTSFHKEFVKKSVIILGESPQVEEVKYLHGNFGKGTFTFYGGHDPEDYQHKIGDPETVLDLHKNSPGYRLILNNILFPAAEKKKLKT